MIHLIFPPMATEFINCIASPEWSQWTQIVRRWHARACPRGIDNRVMPLAPSTKSEAPWALDAYLLVDEWVDKWMDTLPISSAANTVDPNSMA